MSNPYDCGHCHNEGYDHALDCPFHPDNLRKAAELGEPSQAVKNAFHIMKGARHNAKGILALLKNRGG